MLTQSHKVGEENSKPTEAISAVHAAGSADSVTCAGLQVVRLTTSTQAHRVISPISVNTSTHYLSGGVG